MKTFFEYLEEAYSSRSWKPVTSFGKRIKNGGSSNPQSVDGERVRRKISSLYKKFSSWGHVERQFKNWKALGGDKKSAKQLRFMGIKNKKQYSSCLV